VRSRFVPAIGHRRAAKGCEDAAFARWLARDGLADGRTKLGRLGPAFDEVPGKGADEIAIGVATEHLEARQPALAEA
jgi:hypothetical protein